MTMPEMQKAMARLRLTLASIKGKEEELEGLKVSFNASLTERPLTPSTAETRWTRP